jgi:PKD repeat protein
MVSPRPSGPRVHLSLSRSLAVLAVAVLFLTLPVAAQQQVCDRAGCGTIRNGAAIICFTPATPPPSSLWSNAQLQPAYTGALPSDRDTTNFNELYENYGSRNWFEGLEIQNGYVLVALAHGIGVWDARTDPANPALVAAARYPAITGQFPFLPTGELSKIVFGGIAAPDDTVAAITGYSGSGILVFDLTDKAHPRPAYQNAGKSSDSIYAAKIGGTRYAFLAASGFFVYNLDKAITYNGCLEMDGVNPGNCPGVLVKTVSTASSAGSFVHGVDNFVAVGLGSGGFQVFDMTNPVTPVSKLIGAGDRPVQGLAMWKQGATYYLAARLGKSINVRQSQTAIYDVSCVATANGCSGLGSPLSILNLETQSGTEYLSFSRSAATPFLYVGGDAYCNGADGQQREWLLDVSNPASPQDITPTSTTNVSAQYNGVNTTVGINYWSYFYRGSPTGFNLMAPRAGKFSGDYFYRAGRSIMDVHKWIHNVAPTADFSYSPIEIYPGMPVTFTDRSAGVPSSWSWSFQDGAPASSTSQSPSSVTFATPGTKSVTLTASNSTPPQSAVTKGVVVLPPAPQIAGISVSPVSPSVCQPVTLTATGVTGQPTLAYAWGIKDSDAQLGDHRPGGRHLHRHRDRDQRRGDGHQERAGHPQRAGGPRLQPARHAAQRSVPLRDGQAPRQRHRRHGVELGLRGRPGVPRLDLRSGQRPRSVGDLHLDRHQAGQGDGPQLRAGGDHQPGAARDGGPDDAAQGPLPGAALLRRLLLRHHRADDRLLGHLHGRRAL